MRRAFRNTAAIILVVVPWLVCAPVGGFPSPGRRTLAEPLSARHRDDLIVGSDFLDMYIGTTVNPSSVRSRRYPISRSIVDQQPPRVHFERRFHSLSMPQNGLPPTQYNAETQKSFSTNQDIVERFSSVNTFQNQQNRYSETRSHQSNNLPHSKNLQRQEEVVSNQSDDLHINPQVEVSSEASTIMDTENQVFGRRTIPRTSRISMSTSFSRETVVPKESVTNTFAYHVRGRGNKIIPSHIPKVKHEIINDVSSEEQHRVLDTVVKVPSDRKASENVVSAPVNRSFSVTSSVHKVIPKTEQKLIERKFQRTQYPALESVGFSGKSRPRQGIYNEDMQFVPTRTPVLEFTEGTTEPTTFYDSHSTVYEETSTLPNLPDPDTLPTELNDDWTTKSDMFVSEATDKANFPHETEAPKNYDSNEDTTIHVVSVKVTSSVGPSQSTTQSQFSQPTTQTNPEDDHFSVTDSSYYDEMATSRITKSHAISLVTDEQPPAPSIQRSDFSVEESSHSEVTIDPHNGVSSYYSSSFQSPTSHYYQSTSLGSSSDLHTIPNNYRTRVTSSNSGSRVQFFSKSPSYRRGLSFAPLRKEALNPESVEASVVESNRRSYSVDTLPRVSVERSSASVSQTLGKEPVLGAASIQRGVISAQTADTTSDRNKYRQHKIQFGFGRQINYEGDKYKENPVNTDNSGQSRDRFTLEPSTQTTYNQHGQAYAEPEKVYGEPEKVYGEPEKVYGEPEKVYGEPEKVYGEPAKRYGESSKVYGESSKNYEVPEQNYEVDEAVSVTTNGRAHGVQQPARDTSPKVTQPPVVHTDTALKVFDTRQQDPNHKFGYVVEGRDFRKYRVEERTSDGFIVGEYGVVSNDGGNLRGVRYTADGTINPRLIYDTLLKFLSL